MEEIQKETKKKRTDRVKKIYDNLVKELLTEGDDE